MNTRSQQRIHRKRRIRAKLSGSADIPRLSVFRSHRVLSVQAINDVKGETLLSATVHGTTKKDARILGEDIGKKAKEKHIKTVVFDRNGYRYHGVIQELADVMRQGGLKF